MQSQTTPSGTASQQRVPKHHSSSTNPTLDVPLQRVSATNPSNASAVPVPPAAFTIPIQPSNSIVIPLRINQPVRLPSKPRTQHSYLILSPAEVKQTSKPNIKCVGMKFIDDKDPNDVATGIVVSIVRHKKSRKLAFKYWDHTKFDQAPTKAADFNYLDVTYAVSNCRWFKPDHKVPVAASITLDELHRNHGPSRNIVKKARQRQRQPPTWWQTQSLRANSATINGLSAHQYHGLHACTALDLNEDGTPLTSNSALKGPDKAIWEKAHGEEIIRLIDSKTGRFIHRHDMPADRKAAYYNPQLKIKIKNGVLQYRVRGTIGGDQVHYPGETTAYTAHLETIRLLLNAVVSEHASFLTADIKDFYLGTPLERKEYMRINIKHIPADVQKQYNIADMVHNEHVIMEISRSIYGLPQAGKLSQDRLIMHLAKHGYTQCPNTPCLFVHATNGVAFTLVVDDFLIKFKERKAADHLLEALREMYTMTTDFGTTQKYVGITLTHNKAKHTIDMSIPGYVQKALQRFKRSHLRGADSPIIYVPPRYGKFQQEVHPDKPSSPLTPAETLEMQEIVGVFLFYARAVDPTMLTAINKIASRQAKPTSLIKMEIERFLQYANKWPDAMMRIHASNMKLVCHSDGSYLSESEARSRAGGILFLGDCADGAAPNAPISFLSVIISTVVASATETEYAAAFIVGQAAISIVHTLEDLGYPQSETEIFCDNLCAVGIAHNTLNLKRTKTIDMRYHWIRDQVKQKKFKVTWKAGKLNLADFFTKAHPVHHHIAIRSKYVLKGSRTITSSEGVLIQV